MMTMRCCIPPICVLMTGGAFCLAEEPADPQRAVENHNRIVKEL